MLVPRAPDMSDPLSNRYRFLGLAQTTEFRYLSAVNSFLKFHVRELLLPVVSLVDMLMCAYVSDALRFVSIQTEKCLLGPNSTANYLSSISAAFGHSYPDVRLGTNSPRAKNKVLRGFLIQFSKPVKCKDPLTLSDLIHILECSSGSYDQLLFSAASFHFFHRLGELVILDIVLRYLLPDCETDPYFWDSTILLAPSAVKGACAISALDAFCIVTRVSSVRPPVPHHARSLSYPLMPLHRPVSLLATSKTVGTGPFFLRPSDLPYLSAHVQQRGEFGVASFTTPSPLFIVTLSLYVGHFRRVVKGQPTVLCDSLDVRATR
ncbi:hypothetical protein CROQUDRAFT_91396 [Cronartium quercuum f. sp. fusiforme G11]|uniref:Uncharacterized protein n=1 Tax=Cronartium quercuum f. sp. fusiforme G11 TaxID=708437 RepID=A0A9P6NK64_9BASI|nr:hypothetical protein CROQUDRAFT_91396 [Cronartium quercuum f. sp. fusiforme G11]